MELKNFQIGIKNIMENKFGIVGLGYVGLSHAVVFSEHFNEIHEVKFSIFETSQ